MNSQEAHRHEHLTNIHDIFCSHLSFNSDHNYDYSIGYFTVEALISIKGADSPIELVKQVSDGLTWEEAFLKVYGITWKEAAPILAKTVSRMFLERF